MNERIRQLWEDNDTIEVCYPEQGSPVSVSATTLEKFAQLIVRKCMSFQDEAGVYSKFDMADAIAQHFGVEL